MAALGDGSPLLFFHILVSHMGRHIVLLLFVSTRIAWRLGFFSTNDASAHLPVHDIGMPGVHEWVRIFRHCWLAHVFTALQYL
jgi:hypothetical protein